MTTGQKIDALIQDNDMTITDLAKIVDASPKQVTRWRRDESDMGISKLKAICKHYAVSADYLLGLPNGLTWPR